MSVINQMLKDLEQRRSESATQSPLGGLSASNGLLPAAQPMNYVLLGTVLVLAMITAFLFANQRTNTPYKEVAQSESTVTPAFIEGKNEEAKFKDNSVQVVMASTVDSLPPVSLQSASLQSVSLQSVKAQFSDKKEPAMTASAKDLPRVKEIAQVTSVKQPPLQLKLQLKPQSKEIKKSLAENTDPAAPVVIEKRMRPLTAAQQAQKYFQNAVLKLGRGEQDAAHSVLIKALSADPSHIRARETIAALLLNTGRISEASATLRDGLLINPKTANLAKMYARILLDQGDTEQSITVLKQAMPSVSTDPEYYALMAAFYSQAGKHGQAAQVYQQILQVRPGVAKWWMGLGLSFESIGESAQALLSYQRAQRAGGLATDVNKFVTGRIQALSPIVSVHAGINAEVSAEVSADIFEE